MINKGASGTEAALPFTLVDVTTGNVDPSHVWVDIGGGVTNELQIRLPGAVGYDDVIIANIANLGNGDYEYRMSSFETNVPGKVYYFIDITNYDRQGRWEDIVASNSTITGLSDKLDLVLGLLHQNARLDNTTYNSNGLMTSARLRVFAAAAACNAAVDGAADGANGEIYRFTITGVDEGDGKLLSYRLVRTL